MAKYSLLQPSTAQVSPVQSSTPHYSLVKPSCSPVAAQYIPVQSLILVDPPEPLDPIRQIQMPPPDRIEILAVFAQGRFHKKKLLVFWICPNYLPPSPEFGQLVQLFLNAKNDDLIVIKNDSLSKILLK